MNPFPPCWERCKVAYCHLSFVIVIVIPLGNKTRNYFVLYSNCTIFAQ